MPPFKANDKWQAQGVLNSHPKALSSPPTAPQQSQSPQGQPTDRSTNRVGAASPCRSHQPIRPRIRQNQRTRLQRKPTAHQTTVQTHGTPKRTAIGPPLQAQHEAQQD